jgi:hypothetical protein
MVKGIDKFREYFRDFSDHYIIIGGTARDYAVSAAGFIPKGTKDIDIVLIIEALSAGFVRQFWKFIQDGNYSGRELNPEERKYYRFTHPEKEDFPFEIELFSRKSGLIQIPEGMHLTPIPTDESLSRLSAILLSDEYYKFILDHCTLFDGLNLATTEALICFKAVAWLDMTERKEQGERIDNNKINKHKTDIFRLGATLAPADTYDLPGQIKSDMQAFVSKVSDSLPGKEVFSGMGIRGVQANQVLKQLIISFKLNE